MRAAASSGVGGDDVRGTVVAVSASGERVVLWLNGTSVTWSARTPAGVLPMAATLPDTVVDRLASG